VLRRKGQRKDELHKTKTALVDQRKALALEWSYLHQEVRARKGVLV
jgi:hypothetical protein